MIMRDDLGWLVVLLGILLFIAFVVELYVIMLIATFLATWFGFSGLLWWACAILLFMVINGLIGLIWRL